MKILRSPSAFRTELERLRTKSLRIGLVPTMGFLHQGHLSLVRRARQDNDVVAVSLFVNPLQFGPREDFSRYPRDFARDCRLLKAGGADFLFAPQARALYGPRFQTHVVPGSLAAPLCGARRPGHFEGVATVVAKLLNLALPHNLYLGQKDYQQFLIVDRMIKDLDMPVKAHACPIVREKDGLAMSSRNVFLSQAERVQAAGIWQALKACQAEIRTGERQAQRLARRLRSQLGRLTLGRVDYAEIVDAATLERVVKLKSRSTAAALVAVYFGRTRLIDNLLIKVP